MLSLFPARFLSLLLRRLSYPLIVYLSLHDLFSQTFAGSAGHPVFVDAVGRGIKLTQAYHAQLRSNKNTELSDDVIRDWAGPGIFSDCVFRFVERSFSFVEPRRVD